jgi:hypothetical protein
MVNNFLGFLGKDNKLEFATVTTDDFNDDEGMTVATVKKYNISEYNKAVEKFMKFAYKGIPFKGFYNKLESMSKKKYTKWNREWICNNA